MKYTADNLSSKLREAVNSIVMEKAANTAQTETERYCALKSIPVYAETNEDEEVFTDEAQDLFNQFYEEEMERLYKFVNEITGAIEEEPIKVLISLEGGLVKSVSADAHIEYVLVDFDDESEDEVWINPPSAPDFVLQRGDMFHEQLFREDNSGDIAAKKGLKEIDF